MYVAHHHVHVSCIWHLYMYDVCATCIIYHQNINHATHMSVYLCSGHVLLRANFFLVSLSWDFRNCLGGVWGWYEVISHCHRVCAQLSLTRQRCLLFFVDIWFFFQRSLFILLATPKRLAEPRWSSKRTCITPKMSFFGVLCLIANLLCVGLSSDLQNHLCRPGGYFSRQKILLSCG